MQKPSVFFGYSSTNTLEEENRFLRESLHNIEQELQKFKKAPLIACEIKDVINEHALIRLPNGNEFLVERAADCDLLIPGDYALAEQRNLTVIKRIGASKRFDAEKFVIMEKPNISWMMIGGLRDQERELKEVIEMPLTNPEIFKKVGIDPPKGVLLYGPPGTGKTMIAKAVANSTQATFIELVGSELVQKFIGEGAKLVKDIFQLAKEKAPSIIFIDEIDAIAATRIDLGTSGEREVQRTFMQLLAEIDGFNSLDKVKIIGSTNRKDMLDPAIIRPGRLERQVLVPLPDAEGRKQILKIHTKKMNCKKIDYEELTQKTEEMSGAELKAVCTEAAFFTIRQKRDCVEMQDFLDAIDKVKKEEDVKYKEMFG